MSILGAPPLRVDVLTSAEQRSKQRDLGLIVRQRSNLRDIRGRGQEPFACRLLCARFLEWDGMPRKDRFQLPDFFAETLALRKGSC